MGHTLIPKKLFAVYMLIIYKASYILSGNPTNDSTFGQTL